MAKKNLIDLFLEAFSYEKGLKVTQDFAKSADLWQESVDRGSDYATQRLSRLFEDGLVSESDFVESSDGHGRSEEHNGEATEKKILIIDDGEDTLQILEYILSKSGFTPVKANDGVDGLEKTLLHPDICAMLIDLQMPNMNGFEFISTLRTQKAFVDIPIIIVTAFTNKKLLEKGRALGIQGWIAKPINKDLLLSNLHKALSHKEAV